jgi:hypothetical protein
VDDERGEQRSEQRSIVRAKAGTTAFSMPMLRRLAQNFAAKFCVFATRVTRVTGAQYFQR